MKKIIFLIIIILLSTTSAVTYAYTEKIQGDDDNITYTASVRQGWNLLNMGSNVFNKLALTSNSDIQPNDISVVYYYSPSQREYIQIYPELDEVKYNAEEAYYKGWSSNIESASAWVYAKRGGMIEYTTDDAISMTKRELSTGWNFISVTQNALGKSLNDLKGSCSIQKAYSYSGGYNELDLNTKMSSNMASQGLIIKVLNNCKFNSISSNVKPPQLPN